MTHGEQGPRFNGLETRKHSKMESNGSRTPTKPGTGYFVECPECPWHFNTLRKQNEPVRVACSGVTSVHKCPAGHVWYS